MRLIDADALLRYIDAGYLRNRHEICFSEFDVATMVDRQPTIEAVPGEGGFVRRELLMPNKDCPKLRECPLCGAEAKMMGGPEDWHPTFDDPDSGGDPYSIVCSGCECGMVLAFWDIDEAIKAWNNRADHSGEANKMVSNADKIRNMSDEELAKFLLSWIDCDNERHLCCPTERGNFGKCDGRCVNGRIDWLRQPAKEETE